MSVALLALNLGLGVLGMKPPGKLTVVRDELRW